MLKANYIPVSNQLINATPYTVLHDSKLKLFVDIAKSMDKQRKKVEDKYLKLCTNDVTTSS